VGSDDVLIFDLMAGLPGLRELVVEGLFHSRDPGVKERGHCPALVGNAQTEKAGGINPAFQMLQGGGMGEVTRR
jgi:hypothetical protein